MTWKIKNIAANAIRPIVRSGCLTVALGFALGAAYILPVNAEAIRVGVDEATVHRLSAPAATVIVGNPLIADVTVQESDLLIVTGKTFGSTNLIVLNDAGEKTDVFYIVVRRGGVDNVSLYRGAGRISYNCAPRCERTLEVGDDVVQFEATKKEISDKASMSRASSEAAAEGPR